MGWRLIILDLNKKENNNFKTYDILVEFALERIETIEAIWRCLFSLKMFLKETLFSL